MNIGTITFRDQLELLNERKTKRDKKAQAILDEADQLLEELVRDKD